MEVTQQLAELLAAYNINSKAVLTSDEAAQYLGITKSCLYKMTMNREIPHFKSPGGKLCYFNREELEQWMQSLRVPTDDELEMQAQRIIRKAPIGRQRSMC